MDTLIVLVISVVVGLISLLLFYATRKSTGSSEIEGGSSDHDIDTAELEKLQKKSDTAGSGESSSNPRICASTNAHPIRFEMIHNIM